MKDCIVRATYRYEQCKDVPFLYYMSVVAGFIVRGKLIELKQAVGDVVQSEPAHEGSPENQSPCRANHAADRERAHDAQP